MENGLILLDDKPLEITPFLREVYDKYHIKFLLLFFAPAGSRYDERMGELMDKYGPGFDEQMKIVRIIERNSLQQKLTELYDNGDTMLLNLQMAEELTDARYTVEPYPLQFARGKPNVFLYAKYICRWQIKAENEFREQYIEFDARYRKSGVVILNYEKNHSFIEAIENLNPRVTVT
ncbi:MAG: hypothetical protein LBK50_01945 [Candidatus Nomurabacteria bacterium]|jgi:hypothetical protein|nr:hypothetical protein [Candidatus Nomurabacteria bacterium]